MVQEQRSDRLCSVTFFAELRTREFAPRNSSSRLVVLPKICNGRVGVLRNALCFQTVARGSLRTFLGRRVFLERRINGPIPTPRQFADSDIPHGIVFSGIKSWFGTGSWVLHPLPSKQTATVSNPARECHFVKSEGLTECLFIVDPPLTEQKAGGQIGAHPCTHGPNSTLTPLTKNYRYAQHS